VVGKGRVLRRKCACLLLGWRCYMWQAYERIETLQRNIFVFSIFTFSNRLYMQMYTRFFSVATEMIFYHYLLWYGVNVWPGHLEAGSDPMSVKSTKVLVFHSLRLFLGCQFVDVWDSSEHWSLNNNNLTPNPTLSCRTCSRGDSPFCKSQGRLSSRERADPMLFRGFLWSIFPLSVPAQKKTSRPNGHWAWWLELLEHSHVSACESTMHWIWSCHLWLWEGDVLKQCLMLCNTVTRVYLDGSGRYMDYRTFSVYRYTCVNCRDFTSLACMRMCPFVLIASIIPCVVRECRI